MPDTTHYSMMPDILSSATWIRYRQIWWQLLVEARTRSSLTSSNS
jgi:hypothetical protein